MRRTKSSLISATYVREISGLRSKRYVAREFKFSDPNLVVINPVFASVVTKVDAGEVGFLQAERITQHLHPVIDLVGEVRRLAAKNLSSLSYGYCTASPAACVLA